MPVAFVSALFLHPGGEFRSIDKYKGYFRHLADTGVPIFLFLDPRLREYGEELEREWSNIRVLEYTEVEKGFLEGIKEFTLPPNRHPVKDTVDYMCIQLMKLRVMARAAAHPWMAKFSHLAWIDFGIFHMFRDPDAAAMILRRAWTNEDWPKEAILSPSCWPPGRYNIWKSICWRHCGSLLLGPRTLFPAAAERQDYLVRCNLPGLTWEINYWNEMPEHFQTYQANHDDSLLTALLAVVEKH